MKKRIQAYFKGKVQGVGFRFRAMEIAQELEVCGWVKNLPDGKVEIVAEAEQGILEEFLSEINAHFAPYIRDVNVRWLDATGEFQHFGVKF